MASWLILAPLLCGCRQSVDGERLEAIGRSAPGSELIEVTCKPAFELVPYPDIIVKDEDGSRLDAYREYLILEDGKKRYRVRWGTPPRSYGPVQLQRDRTYTFSVATVPGRDGPVSRVVRIVEGGKVIYEAPKEAAVPVK